MWRRLSITSRDAFHRSVPLKLLSLRHQTLVRSQQHSQFTELLEGKEEEDRPAEPTSEVELAAFKSVGTGSALASEGAPASSIANEMTDLVTHPLAEVRTSVDDRTFIGALSS